MEDSGPSTVVMLRGEGISTREVNGELVILDEQGSCYFGGNRTVTILWPLLRQGATVEQLAHRLCEQTTADRREAGEHVVEFVDQLAELGLLAGDGPAGD